MVKLLSGVGSNPLQGFVGRKTIWYLSGIASVVSNSSWCVISVTKSRLSITVAGMKSYDNGSHSDSETIGLELVKSHDTFIKLP